MPEYTIKREDIMVMFSSLVSNTNQATNQVANHTIVNRILEVIRDEPFYSQREIAEIIGEKYSTVKYYMEPMKRNQIIKREGTSQKGKWVIL